ncbi:MAG: hypothetical protein FJ276_26165 [Planctomycetes bacterium]|nr:hypothetical protein [Planctomycetota bacterium]
MTQEQDRVHPDSVVHGLSNADHSPYRSTRMGTSDWGQANGDKRMGTSEWGRANGDKRMGTSEWGQANGDERMGHLHCAASLATFEDSPCWCFLPRGPQGPAIDKCSIPFAPCAPPRVMAFGRERVWDSQSCKTRMLG